MADAVASQTLADGEKNAIMKFTNISDGSGESAVTKVDVSALNASSDGRACSGVKIDKITYATDGMSVRILWDATADVMAVNIPQSDAGCMDFTEIGKLVNDAGAGVTGDINFTTQGHSSGDSYTIILHMTKQYS